MIKIALKEFSRWTSYSVANCELSSLRVCVVGCCLVHLAFLAGCSHSTTRQAINGEVTLDSQPLPDGYITFTPIQGTSGPSAGSEISEGKYAIEADKGVFQGNFRVEIRASRPTGRMIKRVPFQDVVAEFEEYLPARYHDRSELTAEITSGKKNELNFTLQSNERRK